MSGLLNLVILIIAAIAGLYWWKSGEFKDIALKYALDYCQQLDLQLLDQSMVIRGIWPLRIVNSRLAWRRSYQFEFSSTGQQRYQGNLVLVGKKLKEIRLEAYQLPYPEE